jgi:murein DD-endopeptidase MepM/ murein hydrolase activator NlpD
MAERLPFGEIRPTAQPINAFIRPGQTNTPEPARPSEVRVGEGLRAIGTSGGGSIASQADPGRNLRAMAEALTPFNRALTQTLATGLNQLKSSQIEAGYYDELKNQQNRAMLSLQMQQEQGAANAASTVTQIQKVDPEAAQLLQDSNPWRMIGRRRALAQAAAADVSSVLQADLAINSGELSGLEPGSAELAKRKVALTDKVLTHYRLDPEDLEANFYVTPVINRSWDQYSREQRNLYSAELTRNTADAVSGGVLGSLSVLRKTGASDLNGRLVGPQDPGFAEAAGIALTGEIDRGLSVLAGEDKTKALEQLKRTLGLASRDPGIASIVGEIRLGNPKDPLDKRPRWRDANLPELLEMQNKGLGLVNDNYQQSQQLIENTLDQMWYGPGGPGETGVEFGGEEYQARVQGFRQTALAAGYRDPDNYIQGRYREGEAAAVAQFGLTTADESVIQGFIDGLTPQDLDPNNIANIYRQVDQIAGQEPTPELRQKRREELRKAIQGKEKLFNDMPTGVFGQIKGEIKRDMGLGPIKALDPKGEAMSLLIQPGVNVAGAMSAAPQKLASFAIELENLYARQVMAEINDWREKHPGVTEIPAAAQNVLVSQAIAKARKSEEYRRIYSDATGAQPGQVGPAKVGTGPSQGTQPGPQARGVSRAKAAALPASTARAYAVRPVLDKSWLHQELSNINNGKPVSAELYALANRANTSTNRYLLEQLRFYPSLDPKGSVSEFLIQEIRKQQQSQTVGAANYRAATGGLGMVPTGYNSFSPGSWLMNIIMPPAAAATMPPMRLSRGSGAGSGGSFERPASVVYERPDGQPGVDLYFPSKRFPAVLGGVVKDVNREGGYGNYIVVESTDPLTGRKVDVLYGHLADGSVKVRPGQRVSPGQVIGQQGGTGNVRSADGTIASIDFLAPRGAGSKDMTPYSGFDRLRRHVVSTLQSGGGSRSQPTTRAGGGMTGLATYYTGSGGSDGVAGGPTANGERYNPNAMTAAVQWSLRGKYLNKWVTVEDMETGKTVRVWVNDVGQMGGSERSVNRSDPRVIDLSPAAFKRLFGSTSRGVGRIRIVEG